MSTQRVDELFHIHIDAESLDPRLSNLLLDERHFAEKNFVRAGQRGSEYSPRIHITRKYGDQATFNRDYDFIMEEIRKGAELVGYIEGECIAYNRIFNRKPRATQAAIPFVAVLGPLEANSFRQTELHLTVSAEHSEPAAIEALFQMGFFCAYAPKDYGIAQVFTMQGKYRDIAQVRRMLVDFVEQGGFAHARLKEERIVRWWVSGNDVLLPPIIHEIEALDSGQLDGTAATPECATAM